MFFKKIKAKYNLPILNMAKTFLYKKKTQKNIFDKKYVLIKIFFTDKFHLFLLDGFFSEIK